MRLVAARENPAPVDRSLHAAAVAGSLAGVPVSMDERGDVMQAAPSRRQMASGLAVCAVGLGASLAVCADQLGLRWKAPAGPAEAPARVAAVQRPAVPRPVMHGAALRRDWAAFRHLYVAPEGRVIDTANGGASHSEGQGWALMAAQAADDPESFARVLDWTERTLQCRGSDRLHAWRYQPGAGGGVSDLNNATDGDLFIAGALARAAARWGRADYAERAERLARDILGLVRKAGARTVLLPGAEGFEKPDCVLVNPSYYTFGLFGDLAALAPSPLWQVLREEGSALILQARFGHWALPPDWVRVDSQDGSVGIAPGWPPRFSWDAIRVPLHLVWAGMAAQPVLGSFRAYWESTPDAPPAWMDLRTGARAPYPATAGLRAVGLLATHAQPLDGAASFPAIMAATDYYGAGLILLSRLAAEEAGRRAA